MNHSTDPETTDERTDYTRRSILRGMGAGGLALGLAPLVASSASATPARSVRESTAVRQGKAKLLSILQTADIHGQLDTHDEFFWENGRATYRRTGGMARIQSLVDSVRQENPAGTVLYDAGDCFQGSGWVALSRGEVMAPVMSHLQYDAVLPGNWEVVYGKDQLLKVMADYRTPVVASNMYHDAGGQPGDYLFKPVHVRQVAGVRIGVLGFNEPLVPVRQDPAYSVGIKFTFPEENAAEWIRHLREDRQCDVVLAITHMGIAQQVNLASEDYMEGVDYILGADTHERVRDLIPGTHCSVTEPGAFGSFVGRLDLVVEDGQIKDAAYELMEVAEDRYPEHHGMRRVVEEVQAPYKAELSEVLGATSTPLLRYYPIETPMDNLITDALYDATVEEIGSVDVALSNGFRFCPPLVPPPGGTKAITREYLWSMLPVNAGARAASVPAKLLAAWMEKELNNVFSSNPLERFGGWVVRMSGMEVNFTDGRGKGQRLNTLKIGGNLVWDRAQGGLMVDPDHMFTFVACERSGDPADVLCRIKGVSNRRDLSFTLHDAVERYLANNSPVSPRQEGRVTATDLEATMLGQLPGTNYQFR